MTPEKQRPAEFEELLSIVLDGEPTSEDLARLQQIVGDDPAARKTYLASLELHAMLAWQLHWAQADDVLNAPGEQECGKTTSGTATSSTATGGTATSSTAVSAVKHHGRRPIYAIGALLATAASVVLLVTTWPTQSLDADVAAFCSAAYEDSASPVRGMAQPRVTQPQVTQPREGGDKGQTPTGSEDKPEWLLAVLSDPVVQEALADQVVKGKYIGIEITRGRLRLDDKGRPVLVEGIDVSETRRKALNKLIEEDQAACKKIVDALIRHHPSATERDRARLRPTLDRWRAKHIFGPNDQDD